VALVCGVPLGGAIHRGLLRALDGACHLRVGPTTRRVCADLDGGLDGFLARRSANLRRSLERAARRARARGIVFEEAHAGAPDPAALYARILAVEARSWKGLAGTGLAGDEMQGFYRLMLPRLGRARALRLLFARDGERDVAFILGAVQDGIYRGLQLSADAEHATLSLGNLCQLEQVRRLADEGVRLYDLGTDVPYKARWGERPVDTVTLVIVR
jgi:CelD/BcsL family acetyltransferase involved in cellulose biosynthesis